MGDGIAQWQGKPVFIPKSSPGDRLRVRITRDNHDGLHAVIDSILSPGPERRPAPCPHFSACGGCTLQQLLPPGYQAFKTRILHQALAHAGFPDDTATVHFLPAASRRRAEFKISREGGSPRLAFHALRSHTPIALDTCLILEPSLHALIAPINAALTSFPDAANLRSISLTAADSGIDMVMQFNAFDPTLLPDLRRLTNALPIARLSVRIQDGKPILADQRAAVTMRLGDYDIELPPNAFLQATKQGQQALSDFALAAISQASSVADLFCGIGTYSFPANRTARIHAVEGDPDMISNLQRQIKHHAIPTLTAEQRDLFKRPLTAAELNRFDAVILNPPRLGAKAQTEQLAASNVATIAMISCNPATFARDAKILKARGFTLTQAVGIDQFVWSPHLEIAALFNR